MLDSVAACGVRVYVVDLSEMERVHTFVSFAFSPVLLWVQLVSVF